MSNSWNMSSGVYNYLDNSNVVTIQNINCVKTTASTLTFITTEVARNYLKSNITLTIEDSLIDVFINCAIGKVEQEIGGVSILPEIWEQTQTGGLRQISLFRQPVTTITEIKYFEDFDSTGTIIDSSNYRLVKPNMIIHTDGYFKKGRLGDGYKITFECGLYNSSTYTSTDNYKLDLIKSAILRIVAWLSEQRVEFVSMETEGEWTTHFNQFVLGNKLPLGIKHLLMPIHSGTGLI